ncbi:interleukin-15 receptor subunit alpha isoform X5 [Piliocolobus tephrosceles]|uniref:interleukin-15 receptor subunit alpha isoform X5 n=1 Tax=Piliocolobus tephrosceles TaxID=591936 RepID=UPI000C2A2CAB|nr:interleukin-15 receptor subunit alpha isoform X5 [Piliocolobus tephrosceles]
MAPRRARGCRTLGLPALLLLLLLRPPATRGSSNSPASASPVAGITGITCPPPVSVEHADIRVKSYSLYSRERYICNSGFKRKAGTSSLTECVLNKATNIAHWTTPSLKCIRDPLLARQRPAPPFTVTTAGVTPQPESLSPSGKGVYPQGHSVTTVAISTSTVLLCGLSAVSLLACYIKSRQTPPPASVEMEAMEALPVTGETSSRDEDLETALTTSETWGNQPSYVRSEGAYLL